MNYYEDGSFLAGPAGTPISESGKAEIITGGKPHKFQVKVVGDELHMSDGEEPPKNWAVIKRVGDAASSSGPAKRSP